MSWTYLHEGHLLAYEQTLRLLRTDQSKDAIVRNVQAKIAMHKKLRNEAERAESALPGGIKPLQK